jgi:hypothetical protein
MIAAARLLLVLAILMPVPIAEAAVEPDEAAPIVLFRVFLTDGSSLVSYGELARVGDRVVFSIPAGGTPREPLLHPVTLDASRIDWTRTERYAQSARYQQYAARAEADYQRLTDEVAALLNDIALSSDRARALSLAQQAREVLAQWPRTHFGYRQEDLREVVALLDGAISRLSGAAAPAAFELTLVATTAPPAAEPLAAMPDPHEQLDQLVRLVAMTDNATERTALLQSALRLLDEAPGAIDPASASSIRRSLETQLREEAAIDTRYARLAEKMVGEARRAAADARIDDVERVLNRIPGEDQRLGRRRPDVVQALTGSVRAQLDGARRLRLLRDQWSVRRSLYRDYQRAVSSDLVQMAKAQPLLEAIRSLAGPPPDRLAALRVRLSGTAERLRRIRIPEYLRPTHDLLISAFRFAETAAEGREAAILSGDLGTAWEASSSAAGALMMFSRAQQELRALLEPPRLQ